MSRLTVTLEPTSAGLLVEWELEPVELANGEVVALLPHAIAGAPVIELAAEELQARDAIGPVLLGYDEEVSDQGASVRTWRASRATTGPVSVSYLARPVEVEPIAGRPPVDLRREGEGLSGAIKGFLAQPAVEHVGDVRLRWRQPMEGTSTSGWWCVTSLGELSSRDTQPGRNPGRNPDRQPDFQTSREARCGDLETLRDTFVMAGDLARTNHRDGPVSMWWLTATPDESSSFTQMLRRIYDAMADTFEGERSPYRVFLRASPFGGSAASAHQVSFVMTVSIDAPPEAKLLHETLSHELVHEWVRLDGDDVEVAWLNEGVADYYGLLVPLREHQIDAATFAEQVNRASVTAYAGPLRHLTGAEAHALYWSDLRAHRLLYARGMFYLADLDARLREATGGERCVDDLVKSLRQMQAGGRAAGRDEWCAMATELLGPDEAQKFEAAADGRARLGARTFSPELQQQTVDVTVLEETCAIPRWRPRDIESVRDEALG